MDNKQDQSTFIKFQNISLLFTITFIYLKEKDIVRAGIQEWWIKL